MKRLGQFFLTLGLVVGIGTAAALWLPWQLSGFAWLLGVGVTKLAFAGSLGLMGAGAVMRRLAARSEAIGALPAPADDTPV